MKAKCCQTTDSHLQHIHVPSLDEQKIANKSYLFFFLRAALHAVSYAHRPLGRVLIG